MGQHGLSFFDEQMDQSEVKARIIQKYFFAWAQVVLPTAKAKGSPIAYIDLYAGPGRYRNGAASTPILLLEQAIKNEVIRKNLVTFFNDQDENNTQTLLREIDKIPGIELLAHKPHVQCGSVDGDAERFFADTRLIPSFTFIDPFGYKGLSLRIINGVIKDWGCDCVFFFNYNRINAGISNDKVREHMNALFGEGRANELREKLVGRSPEMREALILEELSQALQAMGGKFVLPFCFRSPHSSRTSHSLVFVTKHFKGYDIMKGIMAKESSTADDGVPSLIYSPADAAMPLLSGFLRPVEDLGNELLVNFSGQDLNLDQIYERHSVGTKFIRPNYRDALKMLEDAGRMEVFSTKKTRRKGTYPEHVMCRFP